MSRRPAASRSRARALAAAVLAAGEGKRFKSSLPKVLHEVCGRPLLGAVLDAIAPSRPVRTVVVVGRGAEEVRAAAARLSKRPLEFAHQARQLGTADAARAADEALGGFDGDLLVMHGDTPLFTAATIKALVAHHRRSGAAATVLSATLADPTGYGRVVRDEAGDVEKIVEHLDATPAERRIAEVNSGAYVFDRASLRSALTKVERANRQQHFYLTDVIAILREKGERVTAIAAADPEEILGVNSRAQLAEAAAIARARIRARLMENGVTLVDPAQTYVDATVKVGRDTVLHPLTVLTGSTVVGEGCEIGPGVRARDSRIEAGARVVFSVLDGARVGPEASVGPFAYLRPGARLARGAKVGTFVEVKGATVGPGSKVPHLSYIGDATIGADVNVGAGTITANYDGETRTKARTVVGDGARIGSDTMLVAPVRVGRGAVTGAGSVVTRNVPPDTVAVGAPAKPTRKRKKPVKPKGERG